MFEVNKCDWVVVLLFVMVDMLVEIGECIGLLGIIWLFFDWCVVECIVDVFSYLFKLIVFFEII